MKSDSRTQRMAEIEEAAYAVLIEKGYAGASMLSIAKAAKASNETLYRWYGDKNGLFRAMVERNAARAKAVLSESLERSETLDETLREFGATLLFAILGERAVALNRAAAADPSGELGRALAEAGRDSVAPALRQVMATAGPRGAFRSVDEMVETYFGLLIGDRQIRRVIGALPAPDAAECAARSEEALRKFRILLET